MLENEKNKTYNLESDIKFKNQIILILLIKMTK